jgi:hypothetical protein
LDAELQAARERLSHPAFQDAHAAGEGEAAPDGGEANDAGSQGFPHLEKLKTLRGKEKSKYAREHKEEIREEQRRNADL